MLFRSAKRSDIATFTGFEIDADYLHTAEVRLAEDDHDDEVSEDTDKDSKKSSVVSFESQSHSGDSSTRTTKDSLPTISDESKEQEVSDGDEEVKEKGPDVDSAVDRIFAAWNSKKDDPVDESEATMEGSDRGEGPLG